MDKKRREIQRKLRILRYAEETGHVAKTCRYFGIGRTSSNRWRQSYEKYGKDGLINRLPVPKWQVNRTPIEIEEKVLHLRREYHLGPMRIVWHLERYHGIKISDATVSRMLKRRGVNRLPRGTRMRKVHTKCDNKQVPGHHIQMDVKFLAFIGKQCEKIRRFQYTAIDDATRAGHSESTLNTRNPTRSTSLIMSSRRTRFGSRKSAPTMGTNSRLSFTGMPGIKTSVTPISYAERHN